MSALLNRDDITDNIRALDALLRGELSRSAPLSHLGDLGQTPTDAADWLQTVRGKKASLRHPRLAFFFSANHKTTARLTRIQSGEDKIHPLAEALNCDLQLYEVPASATGDHGAILQAIAHGMTCVQPGLDILGVCMLDDSLPVPHAAALDALLDSGRNDLAALCGAVIAARLARVPVLGAGAGFEYARQLLQQADLSAALHMAKAEDWLEATDDDSTILTASALAFFKSAANLQAN